MMFRNDFPFYSQLDQMDCGPTCLKMIASYYGRKIDIENLRKESHSTREGVSMGGMIEAASTISMDGMAVQVPWSDLSGDIPLPCIVHWRGKHFIVVYKIHRNRVKVANPAFGLISYSKNEFLEGWLDSGRLSEGFALLLEPTRDFYGLDDPNTDKTNVRKFIGTYFRPYGALFHQLLIGLLLTSVLQLCFPFLTQGIVDYGINYNDVSFIYLVLGAQLFLYLTNATVHIIRSWILLHIMTRVNIRIISDFLIRLMGMRIAYFATKNRGDFIQRIYDHERIDNFLSTNGVLTLMGITNVVLFGAVLAYFEINIFIIFLIGTSLYVFWSLFFMKRRAFLDYKKFEQNSQNHTATLELIDGIEEIKLNGSQLRRRKGWHNIQTGLFKLSIASLRLEQWQLRGGEIINEVKNISITLVASLAVVEGHMSLGTLLAVLYIIGQLNVPIKDMVQFLVKYQDARLSIQRILEIHNNEEQTGLSNKTLVSTDEIVLEKVSFKYGGDNSVPVLENISLSIPKGHKIAIVGESGSGKTTLLRLLLGIYRPQSGTIKVGSTKLSALHLEEWRKCCGVVLQNGYIFSDTIERNITESDSNTPFDSERYENALELANVTDLIDKLPMGDQARIGAAGNSLSGGERQRILIARAIYKNPAFIFFDEATSSLDAKNESNIIEKLSEYFKGKTIITVAHRLSTIRNSDKIVVLDNGKIAEVGNHRKLVGLKGKYYELLKNQL